MALNQENNSNKTHEGLVHAICSAPEHDLSTQHLQDWMDLQSSSITTILTCQPRCGYNVITIPLSPKARLRLQEGKAKEHLCKEPTMSYPQCMFHTVVIILFSFALSGGHRAACAHM